MNMNKMKKKKKVNHIPIISFFPAMHFLCYFMNNINPKLLCYAPISTWSLYIFGGKCAYMPKPNENASNYTYSKNNQSTFSFHNKIT